MKGCKIVAVASLSGLVRRRAASSQERSFTEAFPDSAQTVHCIALGCVRLALSISPTCVNVRDEARGGELG